MALTDDLPIPPELAVDTEPLSDEDLAAYFDAEEGADFRALLDLDLERADALAQAADRVAAWRVEDDSSAEWALRKLAMANEEVRRLAEQAQEWQARIGAWFSQASRKPQRTATVMEDKLADYGLRLREVGGPATLTLPSGVIKTSEQKPKVEVADEEALAHWLEVNVDTLLADEGPTLAELVKRAPKVYVGPLRKLVKVAEVADGLELTEELECGHVQSYDFLGSQEDVPKPGDFARCLVCPVDPIEGEAHQREVVRAEVAERIRLVPIALATGEQVPGASVKPGGIVPKVEAR